MLRKLFKHEFKETAKLLLPLDLVLLAVTVIGCILLGSSILQNESFADAIIFLHDDLYFKHFCFIYHYCGISDRTFLQNHVCGTGLSDSHTPCIYNFHHSYKTFDCCVLASDAAVITTGSIFLLIRIAAGNDWDPAAFSIAADALYESLGIPFGEFMSYIILSVLLSCFSMVLMIFASLSVGQLFGQHRTPCCCRNIYCILHHPADHQHDRFIRNRYRKYL